KAAKRTERQSQNQRRDRIAPIKATTARHSQFRLASNEQQSVFCIENICRATKQNSLKVCCDTRRLVFRNADKMIPAKRSKDPAASDKYKHSKNFQRSLPKQIQSMQPPKH